MTSLHGRAEVPPSGRGAGWSSSLAVTKKLQVTRARLSSDSFDDSAHTPCSSADWIAWRGQQLRRRIQSFCAAHLFPNYFLFHFDSPAESAAKAAATINQCTENRRSCGHKLRHSRPYCQCEGFDRNCESCR